MTPCHVSWCDATTHQIEDRGIPHSSLVFDFEDIKVQAAWVERTDAHTGISPHLQLSHGSGPTGIVDMSPAEARVWAAVLMDITQDYIPQTLAAALLGTADDIAADGGDDL